MKYFLAFFLTGLLGCQPASRGSLMSVESTTTTTAPAANKALPEHSLHTNVMTIQTELNRVAQSNKEIRSVLPENLAQTTLSIQEQYNAFVTSWNNLVETQRTAYSSCLISSEVQSGQKTPTVCLTTSYNELDKIASQLATKLKTL